ncbi:MAG: hypothetical protein V4706_02665 [Pseudomonadota bacterium]
MDTQQKDPAADKIELIKTLMPGVYGRIQKKAAEIGREAYALVRRGLQGEPNCFYALEGGRVVGTMFNHPAINSDLALHVVEFGSAHVCIWGDQLQGVQHGAN